MFAAADSWHIFSGHLLQPESGTPQFRHCTEVMWPSYLFVFIFLILVFLKVSSFSRVIKVVQSCFSLQAFRQIEREDYSPFKLYSILLNVMFVLSFSFLIYKLNQLTGLMWSGSASSVQYSFILLIVLLFLVFKNLFIMFLSRFSDQFRLLDEFRNNSFITIQSMGLFLFPCMVLAELSKLNPLVFLSMGIVLISILQVIKWYRGAVFALIDNRIGFLQIIVYFCSLELLPVLVVAKFLIETF